MEFKAVKLLDDNIKPHNGGYYMGAVGYSNILKELVRLYGLVK